MEKIEENFSVALEAFYSNGDFATVFETLLERIPEKELQHATKALAIGAGPGIREIKFFKRLVPKLEKVTFVEPDSDCLEALRKNWNSSFGNEVSKQIHECKMEDFRNDGERYDVILLLVCLYEVEEGQRREILRKCVDEWLNPGGLVYITMADNKYQGKTDTDIFLTVLSKLGVVNLIDINDIRADINAIGKQVYREDSYFTVKELGKINNDFISLFSSYCKNKISVDEIRRVLEEVMKAGVVNNIHGVIVLRND